MRSDWKEIHRVRPENMISMKPFRLEIRNV